MLTTYTDVFSNGKAYVKWMTLLEHGILMDQSTAPISQPLQSLGIEKDPEIEDQGLQLVRQKLVE